MMKRISCIFVVLCLLILPGCQQNGRNMRLFRNGFEQLQELTSVYVKNKQYRGTGSEELKLLAVRNEWRNGEDFYWEGDDGSQHLGYGDNYWTIDPPQHTQWKQMKYAESFSKWWNSCESEEFLTGEVSFRSEGYYIVMEQIEDHGNDNCTGGKHVSTNTFYMDKNGNIFMITLTTVAYKGAEADPNEIHSTDTREYYILPIDVNEAERIIHEKYQMVKE